MTRYYMFIAPKDGEPYRFVAGFRRRWLLWKTVEYSYVPVTVSVNDYAELDGLMKAAERETGRGVKVCLADKMDECCGDDCFYALRRKTDMVEWYTGRRYAKKKGGRKLYETSRDIYDCQLFVRKRYATDALSMLCRDGQDGVLTEVYVRTRNLFRDPCIVTVCVNKRTDRVQYLKSDTGRRLRYTNWLDEAMLIYPEDCEALYERLSTQHKAHSFTMIVRPNADIPASDIRKHERELIQRISSDFYLRRPHETKKQH